MSQVIGRVKVVGDGITYRTEKGAKLNIGGVKRAPVMASDGTVHYSEEIVEATLEFSVLHTSDVDVTAIHAITNATFNFIADNGVKYVMSSAFSCDPPDVTDDGKASFKFAGNAAIKQ
jgi:hypothetical protein